MITFFIKLTSLVEHDVYEVDPKRHQACHCHKEEQLELADVSASNAFAAPDAVVVMAVNAHSAEVAMEHMLGFLRYYHLTLLTNLFP